MVDTVITSPSEYVAEVNTNKPVFNGQMYIGEPDLDPQIPENQKQVYILNENGTKTPIAQPIATSSGGVFVDGNGDFIRLVVDGNYSQKILDRFGSQVYYIPDVFFGEPLTPASGNVVLAADTVADMKTKDLQSGQYIRTKGRDSNANVDGSLYLIQTPAEFGGTPDEIGDITLDNGNIAKLVIEDSFYAEKFDGADAGEKIKSAILHLPAHGGLVDATRFTGVQQISSDIFAGITKPFTLLTGDATFEVDLASYSLTLSSHQKVVMEGTTFQPTVVGSDGWQSQTGLFRTDTITTTGTISATSNQLTVADVTGVEVGCLVGIDGSGGTDNNEETTLTSGIDAVTTTIPCADISTLPSTYTVIINNEIITGTERSGSNLINVTRGAYGSTATSHLASDLVSMVPYQRALVESISGNVLTLSGAANLSVTDAIVLIGSTDVSVSGVGLLDGRQDRSAPDPSGNTFGIKLFFATQSFVGDGLKLYNWDHGGVYLESSWYNNIKGDYTGNSRPAGTTGANVWVFRNSSFNDIQPSRLSDSYIGVFVDDRTSNANLRDGPCNRNVIKAPSIDSTETCLEISGGNNNTYYVGDCDSNVPLRMNTNAQGANPRPCTGNTGHAGSVSGIAASAVMRGENNFMFIGSSNTFPDVGELSKVLIDLGAAQGEYFGTTISTPRKTYQYLEDGGVRLYSTRNGLTTDDPVGRFEVFGSDTSGAGPGIKGAIGVEAGNASASNYQMTFYLSVASVNDTPIWRFDAGGTLIPVQTATRNIGANSLRVNSIYLVNTPDVSSDRTLKTDEDNLPSWMLSAALEIKSNIKIWRWLHKTASDDPTEGNNARYHIGPMAQDVVSILEKHAPDGEDVFKYSMISKTDDGKLSIKPAEIMWLIIASL